MGIEFAKARRRKVTDSSPDLPNGAVKCADPMVIELLQTMWTRELRFYQNTKHCVSHNDLPGLRWEVNIGHPFVEGYTWYRGLTIHATGGQVIIFVGWMQPWIIGGAPDPIVYILGEVSHQDILSVIKAFCAGVEAEISVKESSG